MTPAPAKLYTVEILGLATSLAQWPLDGNMPLQGEARSPACGSRIAISLAVDHDDRVCGLGIAPQACAIGQASAAIFAGAAMGKTRQQIEAAAVSLSAWLAGSEAKPDWPGLDAIAPARAYPARHGAILLAWRAALDALPLTAAAS